MFGVVVLNMWVCNREAGCLGVVKTCSAVPYTICLVMCFDCPMYIYSQLLDT